MISLRILTIILCITLCIQTRLTMAEPESDESQSESHYKCAIKVTKTLISCQRSLDKYFVKREPSLKCCFKVESLRVSCVCRFLNEPLISLTTPDRLLYVAEKCGFRVPYGQKCGGKYFFLIFYLPTKWWHSVSGGVAKTTQ